MTNPSSPGPIARDLPVAYAAGERTWGSDAVAGVLRALDIPYIALVPGSSYRGLHDSLVNALQNEAPQVVLSLSEETAVAIAHGYAKASGRMMGVALHANVGLMRATMGIYNAWCDRVPLLLIGGSGPADAARRRPWIDWIHTSRDQASLIRPFTKWDDTPGSPGAAVEAVMRGAQIARTAPRGPVYVNLDIGVQEQRMSAPWPLSEVARFAAPPPVVPSAVSIAEAAAMLSGARRPLILAGRTSLSLESWQRRIALAEKLHAPVLTNLTLAAAFPTTHPLHAATPGLFLSHDAEALVAGADVLLSLDWLDLAGTLKQACRQQPFGGRVIHVSCDAHNHRGWSADHFGLPPIDVYLMCEADAAVPLLLESVSARVSGYPIPARGPLPPVTSALNLRRVAASLDVATRGIDVCYTRFPLGWHGDYTAVEHPLDSIGYDGGAGIGSGPGMTVGAGIALKPSGRLPIGVMGDGDFLMGNVALWTAVHYRIPGVMVVCNNRSFYNDERHQQRMAELRDRPVENRWIGQRISDPDVDIAALARSQGALGIGPVTDARDLDAALARAIGAAREGQFVVVDVRVEPGYDARG